ncbi:MAG: sigma-70 family RNA polymerase sigma factor [Anaerolineales bacterium]|nr:sigma-70 family RNA polymerase sigma factor [Anaerolineales bacterium]MCW5855993.1 sigma-70 family RNA polymerase sigma factor [Anaerolineales bacterium]
MKDTAHSLAMPERTAHSPAEVLEREGSRLRNFIRSRVPDVLDAEDILQDVFSELVEANQLLVPIDHVTGWLFQVARNRITDLFRKKRPERFSDLEARAAGDEALLLEDLLAAAEDGPDAQLARKALLAELEAALAELPAEQRQVFLAHEVEGLSFNDIAAQTGVGLNTLLSRKRYAVQQLRKRLQHLNDYKEED